MRVGTKRVRAYKDTRREQMSDSDEETDGEGETEGSDVAGGSGDAQRTGDPEGLTSAEPLVVSVTQVDGTVEPDVEGKASGSGMEKKTLDSSAESSDTD